MGVEHLIQHIEARRLDRPFNRPKLETGLDYLEQILRVETANFVPADVQRSAGRVEQVEHLLIVDLQVGGGDHVVDVLLFFDFDLFE